jgi:hypothetical protein
MPIKSFRGSIDDNEQIKINLTHRDGRTGYKIIKFECMQSTFGNSEMVIKVYSTPQTANTGTIDFNEVDLLAAAMVSGDVLGEHFTEDSNVIFDQVIFNQNIFITALGVSSAQRTNYHIELEQMRIDSDEATMATLKNMRTTATQTAG